MKLRKMADAEFESWKSNSIELCANEKMKTHEIRKDFALILAEKSFKRLLPDGINTKNA